MLQTRVKDCLILIFLLNGMLSHGQQFRHAAKMDTVPLTGFYRIPLDSETLSYLRLDHADLRIEDKDKKLVPYLIQISSTPLLTPSFVEFPILSNRIIDSGKTELIVRNDSVKHAFNIKLFIKNAAVSRTGSLSGSNDQQKWFIIDDEVMIGRSYETLKDEYLQEINFPAINYRYFKLVIDNQKNDPMNIIRAGIYTQIYWKRFSTYESNPEAEFNQRDSGKYTLINVALNRPYHINHLTVWASGTKFYNREFDLYTIDSASSTKRFIGEFVLNSELGNTFEFPAIKSDSLLIMIDNKDNPALKIEQITTEHTSVSAIAYLEANNSYRLLLDDPAATKPDYDLVHFKDSIPQSIGAIKPHSITSIEVLAGDSQSRRWWIWPVLIGVIAIMGFLTYKLSGDMKFNM